MTTHQKDSKTSDPRHPPNLNEPKVRKAISAMKDLGISPEVVKPVLKNLLELYDWNWELIEDDNYRTLVDAIFESPDDKKTIAGGSTSSKTNTQHKKRRQNVEMVDDMMTRQGVQLNSSSSNSVLQRKSKFHNDNDITRGTEKIKIPLIDKIGLQQPKFLYIPQNISYQNAYVPFSLDRISDDGCCLKCKGDCLSLRVPCACSGETGGEFAYTPQGQLKDDFLNACISMSREPQNHHLFHCKDCPLEKAKNAHNPEPCKGHVLRKFIKECWRKCGCTMDCGNRVVQRGPTSKLQVFSTEGKGWAVRSAEYLPKGSFVCEYVGEILTNTELYERNKQSRKNERHTYPVYLDADWGSEQVLKDEEALCLDATNFGNVARFINHRCFDSNLIEIPVEVETPDHHYYHIAFFTKRNIDPYEELTWDYGIDFEDVDHPIKAFECQCGSAYCRDVKRKATTETKRKDSGVKRITSSSSSKGPNYKQVRCECETSPLDIGNDS